MENAPGEMTTMARRITPFISNELRAVVGCDWVSISNENNY
jgi:hypothetical protein